MTRARAFASTVCVVTGVYYSAFGALLFFSPHVFWSRIAPIGPFNEHYARDVGSFLLPLGIFLLVAASDPIHFRAVVVLAAATSALHAIGHLVDGIKNTRDVVSDFALSAVAILLFAILPRRERERT